jgi:Secretion system C-terminal sorting domain
MKSLITLVIVIVSLAGSLYAQNGSHKLSGQIYVDKFDRTTDGGFICLTSDSTTKNFSRWTGAMTNKWSIEFPKSSYYLYDVIPRPNGNFLISGILNPDTLWMCTLDPSGNALWQKHFIAQAKGFCKVQKDIGINNGYLMAMQNNVLVKCNQYGGIDWQKKITSSLPNTTLAVAAIVSYGSDYLVALKDSASYLNPDSSNNAFLIIDANGNLKKSVSFIRHHWDLNDLDVCITSNRKDIYVKSNENVQVFSSPQSNNSLVAVLDSNLQVVSASVLGVYWNPNIGNAGKQAYWGERFVPAGDGDSVYLVGNQTVAMPYMGGNNYTTTTSMTLNKIDRLGTILTKLAGQPFNTPFGGNTGGRQGISGLYQNQNLIHFSTWEYINTVDLNNGLIGCRNQSCQVTNLTSFQLPVLSATFTLSPSTAVSNITSSIDFTPSTKALSTSCGSMTTNLANEITQDEVSAWVNQNNMVETNLPAESITKISVFNLQGQLITKSNNTQSISGLSSGLYICEINLKNRKSFTAKLLVP